MAKKMTDLEKVRARIAAAVKRQAEQLEAITSSAPALAELGRLAEVVGEGDWHEALGIGDGVTGIALTNQVEALIRETGHRDHEKLAEWLRSNIAGLMKAIGAERGICNAEGCNRPVWWITTKNGRPAPITDDGLNHFADCEFAERFRGRR